MESITEITVYIILEIIGIFPPGSAAEENQGKPASWMTTPFSLREFLAVTCTAIVVLLYFLGLLGVTISMLRQI